MGHYENIYPYTNYHNINLDWILGRVKHMEDMIDDVINGNCKFVYTEEDETLHFIRTGKGVEDDE